MHPRFEEVDIEALCAELNSKVRIVTPHPPTDRLSTFVFWLYFGLFVWILLLTFVFPYFFTCSVLHLFAIFFVLRHVPLLSPPSQDPGLHFFTCYSHPTYLILLHSCLATL